MNEVEDGKLKSVGLEKELGFQVKKLLNWNVENFDLNSFLMKTNGSEK